MFKTSQQVVTEIHNEFDNAQERLLAEAKEIINSYTPVSKAERLESVGFINSEIVVKHKKSKDVLVKNKEQAELIEYYKQHYPFQKFLTEDELDRICKKYNLIYAPISNYIKDVPEKNLTEVERVPTLEEHLNAKDKLWCELKYDETKKMRRFLRMPYIVEGRHFADWYSLNIYMADKYGDSR